MKFLYQVSNLTKKPVEVQYHLEDIDAIVARDTLLSFLSDQPSLLGSSNKEQVSLALVAYDGLSTEEQSSAKASIAEIFSKESATKLAAFRSDARNLDAYQEMVGHNLSPDSPHVRQIIIQRFEKWFGAELGKTSMLTQDYVRKAAAGDIATWHVAAASSVANERLQTYADKLGLAPQELGRLLNDMNFLKFERAKTLADLEGRCVKAGLNIKELCAVFGVNYRSAKKDQMVEQRMAALGSSWPPKWNGNAKELRLQIARIQDDDERRSFLKAHQSDTQPSANLLRDWIADAVSTGTISKPRRGARPAVIGRCQAYLQGALDKIREKGGSSANIARLNRALAALGEDSILPAPTENAEDQP